MRAQTTIASQTSSGPRSLRPAPRRARPVGRFVDAAGPMSRVGEQDLRARIVGAAGAGKIRVGVGPRVRARWPPGRGESTARRVRRRRRLERTGPGRQHLSSRPVRVSRSTWAPATRQAMPSVAATCSSSAPARCTPRGQLPTATSSSRPPLAVSGVDQQLRRRHLLRRSAAGQQTSAARRGRAVRSGGNSPARRHPGSARAARSGPGQGDGRSAVDGSPERRTAAAASTSATWGTRSQSGSEPRAAAAASIRRPRSSRPHRSSTSAAKLAGRQRRMTARALGAASSSSTSSGRPSERSGCWPGTSSAGSGRTVIIASDLGVEAARVSTVGADPSRRTAGGVAGAHRGGTRTGTEVTASPDSRTTPAIRDRPSGDPRGAARSPRRSISPSSRSSPRPGPGSGRVQRCGGAADRTDQSGTRRPRAGDRARGPGDDGETATCIRHQRLDERSEGPDALDGAGACSRGRCRIGRHVVSGLDSTNRRTPSRTG